MGQTHRMTCNDCGKSFESDDGGGFQFYLLRCDTCGKEETVGFPPGRNPTTEAAEETAGKCSCGGDYKSDAPPRCPGCKSTDLIKDPDGPIILYD